MVTFWGGIRFLFMNDFRNARWKSLAFIIFLAYVFIFTVHGMAEILSTEEKTFSYTSFMIEFLFLVVFSSFGLITTHQYGWKKDLFAERISYLRSLPIKIEQIVWARILGATVFSFLALFLFYFGIALYMNYFPFNYELTTLVLHGVVMYSIMYVLTLLFLYLEMIKTAKQYSLFCWIFPVIILIIMLGYRLLFKFSLLLAVQQAVIHSPYLMVISSIVLIFLGCILGFRIINKAIRLRNIL